VLWLLTSPTPGYSNPLDSYSWNKTQNPGSLVAYWLGGSFFIWLPIRYLLREDTKHRYAQHSPETKAGDSAVDVTLEEFCKQPLVSKDPIEGRKVSTIDEVVLVYQDRDLNAAAIGRPPKGTEIQLGFLSEVEGRQWIEAVLPDGKKGYVLAASARSHSVLNREHGVAHTCPPVS